MQPFWGTTVKTLALSNASECDPGPPLAYSEQPASAFYGEAAFDYQLSKALTPEQLLIARYWADGAGTFSGPGHAMAIVKALLTQRHGTLADAAEAFARAGIADADAFTAIWWVKYHYNLIRPITYIRRVIDPTWSPVLPTPPFPEYVSAHSGQSAAVMATLETLFGTNVPFVDHAHDADGFAPRSFPGSSPRQRRLGSHACTPASTFKPATSTGRRSGAASRRKWMHCGGGADARTIGDLRNDSVSVCLLAKLDVVGSSPIARSLSFNNSQRRRNTESRRRCRSRAHSHLASITDGGNAATDSRRRLRNGSSRTLAASLRQHVAPASSAVMRRSDVREFGEQVVVGSRVVRLYFAIREERNEVLDDAVREQPAVRRIDRGACGIVWQNVRQHRPRHAPRLVGRVSAAMLE